MEDMRRKKNPAKAQSAMEYLMTYGWAILIIAVVLGALFQLGVFNASTFAPRAPPGACQVFRPNGPGTSSLINLEGVCSGELPQYVGVFAAGPGAHIVIPLSAIFTSMTGSLTYSGWFYSSSLQPSSFGGGFGSFCYCGGNYRSAAFYFQPPYINFADSVDGTSTTQQNVISQVTPNTWFFATGTFNSSTQLLTLYINGKFAASANMGSSSVYPPYEPLTIGYYDNGNPWNESVANTQVYNISLSASEVTALYDEGIGGAPLRLQNLVGWWPLNGNANDYSGNNNNGVPSSVTYTNQWTSGYTAP